MAKVTTIAQLEQEVKKRINWSLRNQIAPLIKEEIKKSVDDEVYDVYDPTRYKKKTRPPHNEVVFLMPKTYSRIGALPSLVSLSIQSAFESR